MSGCMRAMAMQAPAPQALRPPSAPKVQSKRAEASFGALPKACALGAWAACVRAQVARRAAGSAAGYSPLKFAKTKQPPVLEEDSASWVLPSVDKDVGEWHAGRAPTYAFVQTSVTLYLFTPLPPPKVNERGEKMQPDVELDLQQEGTIIRLVAEGQTILNGRLAHGIKPGDQIWMVEAGGDGREFVVCELDKLTPGINWTSVMEPEVAVASDYAKPVVELPEIQEEEEARLVEETLGHLRKSFASLNPVEGRGAQIGDVLKIDMQGYELNEEGGRGEPLEVGSATGLEMELGASNFSKQVEKNLEGITVGETRDVEVTLGQRAGGLGGQQIICSVTCQELKERFLPELTDYFAQMVKRQDLFKQAGTPEGIPEEEGKAEAFTIDELRKEIGEEVRQAAYVQANENVDAQLKSHLRKALEVKCHWAELGDDTLEEELSTAAYFVAEREGLLPNIDMDTVERETWDKLGEPDSGETMKQVGSDPAREFQDANRIIFRRHLMDEVLNWLRQNMEMVEAGEGQ
ncbi:unnamed protein product [Effrenium voratum]|uniref:Uncharacterized protein n=1 Tax=Effrenium voratum TaxID=2562239 RepID=A0AA36HPG4_9DINO|nr:unnamed protein product [Effrenium voratum]CAJ1430198.1 unnamed protein product [Effrenium voratum]